MEEAEDATGPSRRTWSYVLAGAGALLGIWYLSDGEVAIGIGWLALGAANFVSTRSRRVDAFLSAPIFRRKK